MQVVKEEVNLIDWKAGLLTGMPPWSNDSLWEEERQLLPNGWSPTLSNLQFAPPSPAAMAVQAQGRALTGTSGISARSLLPDQPALSFLFSSDGGLQRIKVADTQCHCFTRKRLEIILTAFDDVFIVQESKSVWTLNRINRAGNTFCWRVHLKAALGATRSIWKFNFFARYDQKEQIWKC